MAKQTSLPTSCRHSRLNSNPKHNPSHHSTTPTTTLISSKLHHHQDSPLNLLRSPSRNGINLLRLPTHILLLILLTCIVPLTQASIIYIPEQMVETPKGLAPAAPEKPEDPRSALSRLAASGPILVDLSPPPKAAQGHEWTLATVADNLRKRQVGGDVPGASSTSTKPTSTTKHSSTAKATEAASTKTTSAATSVTTSASKASSTASIAAAEDTGSTPLPHVFDNGFNANISDSCATFMSNMLANDTFKACLPVSLLLQNSNSFFQTTKSVVLTTRLLDNSCAANVTLCSSVLLSFAQTIIKPNACATDLSKRNPLITQARLGLLAYKSLYTASCLRNSKTASYCFADAVTNKTSPSDGYVYYLPLNSTLPGPPTKAPTCSGCLKDTMAVFGGSDDGAGGGNEALGHTYVLAAQLINQQCGPNFVNATLSVLPTNSSPSLSPSSSGFVGLLTLAVWAGNLLL